MVVYNQNFNIKKVNHKCIHVCSSTRYILVKEIIYSIYASTFKIVSIESRIKLEFQVIVIVACILRINQSKNCGTSISTYFWKLTFF